MCHLQHFGKLCPFPYRLTLDKVVMDGAAWAGGRQGKKVCVREEQEEEKKSKYVGR